MLLHEQLPQPRNLSSNAAQGQVYIKLRAHPFELMLEMSTCFEMTVTSSLGWRDGTASRTGNPSTVYPVLPSRQASTIMTDSQKIMRGCSRRVLPLTSEQVMVIVIYRYTCIRRLPCLLCRTRRPGPALRNDGPYNLLTLRRCNRQPILIGGRRIYDSVKFKKARIRLHTIGMGPED